MARGDREPGRGCGKSAARVAAGRRNRQLRGLLTADGRERLRQAAHRVRPWLKSTGPRTREGKQRAADNGRWRQRSETSLRAIKAELADVPVLIAHLKALRKVLVSKVQEAHEQGSR